MYGMETHFGEDGVLGSERPDIFWGRHLQRRTLGDPVEPSPGKGHRMVPDARLLGQSRLLCDVAYCSLV